MAQPPHFSAPAGKEFAKVVPTGRTILPNGRFLTPTGIRLYTGDDLWNVLPSPNGKWIVGFCDPGIVIYPNNNLSPSSNPFIIPWSDGAFRSVFTRDSSRLTTSSGDAGHGIQVFETADWDRPPTKRLEMLVQKPVASETGKTGFASLAVIRPFLRVATQANVW